MFPYRTILFFALPSPAPHLGISIRSSSRAWLPANCYTLPAQSRPLPVCQCACHDLRYLPSGGGVLKLESAVSIARDNRVSVRGFDIYVERCAGGHVAECGRWRLL